MWEKMLAGEWDEANDIADDLIEDIAAKREIAAVLSDWDADNDGKIDVSEIDEDSAFGTVANIFAGDTTTTFSIEDFQRFNEMLDLNKDGKISNDAKSNFGTLVASIITGKFADKTLTDAEKNTALEALQNAIKGVKLSADQNGFLDSIKGAYDTETKDETIVEDGEGDDKTPTVDDDDDKTPTVDDDDDKTPTVDDDDNTNPPAEPTFTGDDIAASVLDEIKAFGISGEVEKINDTEYKITKGGQEYKFEITSSYDDTGKLTYTITSTTQQIKGGATETVTKTFKNDVVQTSIKSVIINRGNGVTQTFLYTGNSDESSSIITTKGDITVTDNNGAEGANVTIDPATGELSISVQNADGETVIIPVTSDMEIDANGKIKGYKYVGNQLANGEVDGKWYNNGIEITKDATGKTKEDYKKAIMEQFPNIDSIEAVGLFEVNGKMVWRRTAFTIDNRVYTNAVWDTDDTLKSFKYTITGQEDNVRTYTKTGSDSYTISKKANNGTMVVVHYEGGLWDRNNSQAKLSLVKDTEGKNYTGIVMGNYYEAGTLAQGTDIVGNELFINGEKDTTVGQKIVTVDGVRYLFNNGTLETGNKTVKGADNVDRLYINGRAAQGQIGSDYYVDGVKQTASAVKPSHLMSALKSTSGNIVTETSIKNWYNANKGSADQKTKDILDFIKPLLTIDSTSGNATAVSELFKVIANNFEYGSTSTAAGNNKEISLEELKQAFTGSNSDSDIALGNNAIKELERKMGILAYLGFTEEVNLQDSDAIQGINNVVITSEGLRRDSALLANTIIYVKNKNGGFTGYVFNASSEKTEKEFDDNRAEKPAATDSYGNKNIQWKLVNVNGKKLWRAASWDNSAGHHITNVTYDAQGRRKSYVWTDKNNASNTQTFTYIYQSTSENESNYTKYSMTYAVNGKTLTFTHTGKNANERLTNGSLQSVTYDENGTTKNFTGVANGLYFENGKLAKGLDKVGSNVYYDGKKFNGTNITIDNLCAQIGTACNANKLMNYFNTTTNTEYKAFLSFFVNVDSTGKATSVKQDMFKLFASGGLYGSEYNSIDKQDLLAVFGLANPSAKIGTSAADIVSKMQKLEQKLAIVKKVTSSALKANECVDLLNTLTSIPEGLYVHADGTIRKADGSLFSGNIDLKIKNESGTVSAGDYKTTTVNGARRYKISNGNYASNIQIDDNRAEKPAATNSKGATNIQWKLVNVNGKMLWRAASWTNSAGNHITNVTYDAQGIRKSYVLITKNLQSATYVENGATKNFTGIANGYYFEKGKLATGYDTVGGYLYKNGVKLKNFGFTVRTLINTIEYGDDGKAANSTELAKTGNAITKNDILNYLKQSYADARIKFILQKLGIITIAKNGTISINDTNWKKIAINDYLYEKELSIALYGVNNKLTTQIKDGTGLRVNLC